MVIGRRNCVSGPCVEIDDGSGELITIAWDQEGRTYLSKIDTILPKNEREIPITRSIGGIS